ncbi:MAG: hypothetical protein KC613_09380 [Myxococcales bacterium]|nr:hypothetical protein [Myxococcales bacterium]
MRALCLALAALGAPAVAGAQQVPVRPGGQAVNTRGKVKVDYAELRAGPGVAFLPRGRAYMGDLVDVLARDESGDWLEITAGGVRGWVPLRAVDLRVGGDRAEGGRDRRQQNYRYDAEGRRVFLDGTTMGSGEGTQGRVEDPLPPEWHKTALPLAVRVGFGAGRIRRDFEAAIEPDSPLRKLAVSPMAITTEIGVDYTPHRHLALRLNFRDARLSDAVIPANPNYGFVDEVAINTNAQQLELDVVGRLPLAGDAGWIGAYGGLWLFRQAFQKTDPVVLFLTTAFTGASAGLAGGWTLGPVELAARAGLALPLAVSQDPADSGDADSLGVYGGAELAWAFHRQWALVGAGWYTRVQTDFSGGSTHVDPLTGGAVARDYQTARQTDGFVGGSLGVRWRP